MLALPHARKPAPPLAARGMWLRLHGGADAFGSALGDAVVGSIQRADASKVPSVVSAEEKAQILAGFADGPTDRYSDGGRAFDKALKASRLSPEAQARKNWDEAIALADAEVEIRSVLDREENLQAQHARADAYRKELNAQTAATKATNAAAAAQAATWTGGAGGGRGFVNPPLAAASGGWNMRSASQAANSRESYGFLYGVTGGEISVLDGRTPSNAERAGRVLYQAGKTVVDGVVELGYQVRDAAVFNYEAGKASLGLPYDRTLTPKSGAGQYFASGGTLPGYLDNNFQGMVFGAIDGGTALFNGQWDKAAQAGVTLAAGSVIKIGKNNETNSLHFSDFNQARNAALTWLGDRGFSADQPVLGKFGDNKGLPVGMKSAEGNIGFRVEYDERSKAHINVFAGKEKGPHITFDGNEEMVNKIVRQFVKERQQ